MTFCEVSALPMNCDAMRDADITAPIIVMPMPKGNNAIIGVSTIPNDPPIAVVIAIIIIFLGRESLRLMPNSGFGTITFRDANNRKDARSARTADKSNGASVPYDSSRYAPKSGVIANTRALIGVITLVSGRDKSPPVVVPNKTEIGIAK